MITNVATRRRRRAMACSNDSVCAVIAMQEHRGGCSWSNPERAGYRVLYVIAAGSGVSLRIGKGIIGCRRYLAGLYA